MSDSRDTSDQLLLMQLDGVSSSVLTYGLSHGYCVNLARLCHKKHFRIVPYQADVPAMTHPMLSQLFFGKNSFVSGYMWFDRSLHRFVRAADAHDSVHIEKQLLEHCSTPLLTGGSAVCSPFAAGAQWTSIMPFDMDIRSRSTFIRGLLLLYRYTLYPLVVLRLVVVGISRIIDVLFRRRRWYTKSELFIRFRDMGEQLLFGDITRSEIVRALDEGNGPYYVNFALYDEMAHQYGKYHPMALEALRHMDRSVGRIVRKLRLEKRSMNMIIFSDHGQHDTVSLETHIHDSMQNILEGWFGEKQTRFITSNFYDPNDPQDAKIFVCANGSFLQIHFSARELVTDATIETRYPGSLYRILMTPGVGGVFVRVEEGQCLCKTASGDFRVSDIEQHGEAAQAWLKSVGATAEDFLECSEYFLHVLHADVLVFGGLLPNGKIIGFEDQKSLHGGWFGDMRRPFVMSDDVHILSTMDRSPSLSGLIDALRLRVCNTVMS